MATSRASNRSPFANQAGPESHRPMRATTMRTIRDLDDFEARNGWRPGTEPGVDTSKPDGGHSSMTKPYVECQITVVDFSIEDIKIRELDNAGLIDFLKTPRPAWAQCRWINVNGLSWDVIRAVGQYKDLHRLAIEDMMNTGGRTKADWYHDHAFLVFTLQKLITRADGDMTQQPSKHTFWASLRQFFKVSDAGTGIPDSAAETGASNMSLNGANDPPTSLRLYNPRNEQLRTIHRYHASPNNSRAEFMEDVSALRSRDLVVVAEQVSIFLTSDNTVIAFFEASADDIEVPILARLSSPSTTLRQSCDGSLLTQAILDVIVDMAIPVQSAYSDVMEDIEMDVLTQGPSIQQSKDLYILAAEVKKMRSLIQPLENILNALREHKASIPHGIHTDSRATLQDLRDPTTGVMVSPLTAIYLSDVLDHCLLIRDNLTDITKAADDLIDLIFNTVAAYQNETLKQLTFVTIVFLPMSFLTGYFGQNFEPFPELAAGIGLFWKIVVPTIVGTVLLLQRSMIYNYVKAMFQRRRISDQRRKRERREREKTRRPPRQ